MGVKIDIGTEERRALLRAQLGLKELFIDVARFCAITGFSTSTVYEHIRVGSFFLPIVKMGRKPYIAVEDLVSWYESRGEEADSAGDGKNIDKKY